MQVVFDVLEKLKQEGTLREYAVGGATAAGIHGEPLATRDIDVFVFLEPPASSLLITLEPLFSRLAALGFSTFDEEGLLIADYPVQFLAASPGLETEALTDAVVMEWDNHQLRIIGPEHLAAMAMTVGRPKDRARVVYLVELPQFDRELFSEILKRHQLISRWKEWSSALGLKTEV